MKAFFNTRKIGTTLIGMTLSAIGIWSFAASPEATIEQSISSQISSDIETAVQKNQEAGSSEEWITSGYTSADIFKSVQDLSKRHPEAWTAACNTLQKFSPDDLALFEAEIQNPQFAQHMPCANHLLSIIQKHWKTSEVALAKYESKIRISHYDDEGGETEEPEAEELELIEKVIDPSQGGIYYRGDLGPKEIALTFDDGPHPTRTPLILKALREAGVKATFFELGENVQKHPELSKTVLADGHTVGSHTVHHPLLTRLVKTSLPDAEAEITQGRQILENVLGVPVPFFRYPYGAGTKTLRSFVKESSMATFHWNIDSEDWKTRNPKLLYKKVLRVIKEENESGIILFHDIQQQTAIALPLVLKYLKANNYKVVVFVPKK